MDKTTVKVSRALTSLPADRGPVEGPAATVRNHRGIQNRLHNVRESSNEEDRWRACVSQTPGNRAALSNAAISTVRRRAPRSVTPTHRHFNARAKEALDLILNPSPAPPPLPSPPHC